LQVACNTKKPVSALLLNGRRDATVPYAGMRYSHFLRTSLTPVPTASRRLAARSGCVAAHTTTSYRYITTAYRGCARGAAVTLVTAPRLGHRWPTRDKDRIDGEQLVWDFLSHRVRRH
jgi:poly(3-hydroxybutyrate) depolymerase